MKRKIQGVILLLIIIFILKSEIFTKMMNFYIWLVTLHYSINNISSVAEIFVKVSTFIFSYGLVGLAYDLLGFHDKVLMSWSYYLVSTIFSICLSYLVMCIQKYILIISIVLSIALIAMILIFIVLLIVNRKKNEGVLINE